PGSSDLTAGVTTGAELFPLSQQGISRPITGTPWQLQTSAIPASGVLGLEVIGFTDPGLNDLSFLGMPGCGLRANLDSLNAFLVGGSTHTWSLPIPNNPVFSGVNLYATSAVYTVPALNAFGIITANATQATVGTL